MNGILALMYHAVRRDGDTIPATDFPYSVAEGAFLRHLDMLDAEGYVLCDPEAPAVDGRRVVLTFDDSWESHATVALPILRDRKARAFFFLTTEQLDQPGMLPSGAVRELADAGMVIGSHGVTHRYFDTLDEPQLLRELIESRHRLADLADLAGREVTWLSLPGGRWHPMIEQVAEDAGYTHIATSRAGLWRGEPVMPRLPVMDATDDRAFLRLLRRPASVAFARGVRQAGKEALRRGLGNRAYDWLRNALLPKQ